MHTPLRVLHIAPDFNYSCGISNYLNILFHDLSKHREIDLHFVTSGGNALERLDNLNIKITIIPFSKGFHNILFFIPFLLEIIKYIKTNHIDIIHTHHRFPEFVASLISSQLNIKTVSTVHSLTYGLRLLSYNSHILIAISKSVQKHLSEYFHTDKSIVYHLYNPVKIILPLSNKTDSRKKLGIQAYCKVLLFVGTASKSKGIDVLLEAFLKIKIIYRNIKLLIVGDSNALKRYPAYYREDVIFYQQQNDLSLFYSASDIVILPSRVEALGYAMLESGLYKRPFIGSKVNGIAEFIEHRIDGLLVSPGSVSELVDAILFMLNNQVKADIMARNLFDKVSPLTDISGYVNQLIKIYDSLAA